MLGSPTVARVPFQAILLGLAGAWLATLGACGRTMPGLDEFSNGTVGDDDDSTSGSGGASARGGASADGGSNRGGTSNRGGSSNGGTAVNTGGAAGNGRGGSSRGGSSFGGGGGDVALGGTFGKGGTFAVGGSFMVGGSMGLGGTFAVGGAMAMGGSTSAGAGGSIANGGMGAQGGSSPGGITCGDSVCDPATSVCCSRRSQGGTCIDVGSDCQGATLTCSGPGTCGEDEVCCFHGRSSFCTTDCQVSQGGPGNPATYVLCDSTADCGPDQTCVLAPRGVAYCGDNL